MSCTIPLVGGFKVDFQKFKISKRKVIKYLGQTIKKIKSGLHGDFTTSNCNSMSLIYPFYLRQLESWENTVVLCLDLFSIPNSTIKSVSFHRHTPFQQNDQMYRFSKNLHLALISNKRLLVSKLGLDKKNLIDNVHKLWESIYHMTITCLDESLSIKSHIFCLNLLYVIVLQSIDNLMSTMNINNVNT